MNDLKPCPGDYNEAKMKAAWDAQHGMLRGAFDLAAFKAGWDAALAMQWLPINSAPKDGQRLLLSCADTVHVGYWSTSMWAHGGSWVVVEDRSDTWEIYPTHWATLPQGMGKEAS